MWGKWRKDGMQYVMPFYVKDNTHDISMLSTFFSVRLQNLIWSVCYANLVDPWSYSVQSQNVAKPCNPLTSEEFITITLSMNPENTVWDLSSYIMVTSSNGNALLVLCDGNLLFIGEFPSQRLMTRGFDVFFDLCLNKRLSKPSRRWWFEMPLCTLWRQCNVFLNCSRGGNGSIFANEPVTIVIVCWLLIDCYLAALWNLPHHMLRFWPWEYCFNGTFLHYFT